jgi:uncharacterized protein YueI
MMTLVTSRNLSNCNCQLKLLLQISLDFKSSICLFQFLNKTMTESVGNETIENTGDFCLVIGTDHALTEFINLR